MRRGLPLWIEGALIAAADAPLARTDEAGSQDCKVPLSLSHFVYRDAEDAEGVENLRAWTFGLDVILGPKSQAGYGLVAHVTYGGPYWYLAGSAGMWNGRSTVVDDFGLGVSAHYNVFQSRDFRTRLGWQAGWSTSSSGSARTHAIDYSTRRLLTPQIVVPQCFPHPGTSNVPRPFSKASPLRSAIWRHNIRNTVKEATPEKCAMSTTVARRGRRTRS